MQSRKLTIGIGILALMALLTVSSVSADCNTTIYGVVRDGDSQAPLAYVNLTVLCVDNGVIETGVSCPENGTSANCSCPENETCDLGDFNIQFKSALDSLAVNPSRDPYQLLYPPET